MTKAVYRGRLARTKKNKNNQTKHLSQDQDGRHPNIWREKNPSKIEALARIKTTTDTISSPLQ